MRKRAAYDLPPLSPRGTARQALSPAPAAPPALLAELRDADLDEGSLYLAWQVAEWAVDLPPEERAHLMGLVGRSLLALREGSTRLPVDAAARALLARAPQVVGRPGERKPLILDGDHLYHQKLLGCEERLVQALASRLRAEAPFPPSEVERALAAVTGSAIPAPSEEQRQAVRAALGGRLALVSGGPGTGKTTIALAIVRALVRLGLPVESIALAAPTGKAANRLEEAVRGGLGRLSGHAPEDEALRAAPPRAETLHRLLGYSPGSGTFRHHANNRLAHRAVIVDEGSMIDLFLMDRLLRALGEEATLVLIGDADQLPSVEAGAVFRDLAPLGVRLGRSFRVDAAAGVLLDAARRVNAGDAAGLAALITERPTAEALAFDGVELLPPSGREGLLERWYQERVASPALAALAEATLQLRAGAFEPADQERLEALHGHHQRARLLCPTRGRPTGVEATNAWLHQRHGGAGAFSPGEPVMMLRNDYDRGLWNGDQGLVVQVREGGRSVRLAAAFRAPSGWTAFDLDGLRDTLELSFAMTVHKAQGSELDLVALLLPDAPLPLLTRELVYTALTRSRRALVICGGAAVLAAGVTHTVVRSSGLRERLAARGGG